MFKRSILAILSVGLIMSASFAEPAQDQTFINQMYYRNSKLSLEVKKRTVDEIRRYSNTSIDTTAYSYENYSYSNTDISRSSLARAETKEITDWYIYRGALRELSDFEFLDLIGDQNYLNQISKTESGKNGMRLIGNTAIGIGLIGMIGGAGLSAAQQVITTSALVTVVGFFISAFNQSPAHYIQPDYAQQKILEYNLKLKKDLNLPVQFE